MMGPGKYDDLCTEARLKAKAEGAVLLIVNGEKGGGFAAQLSPELLLTLPTMLRQMADQMEEGPKH